MEDTKRTILLHPLLFALYPILFLYSRNIGNVLPRQTMLPFAISLILAAAAYAVFSFALKSPQKASLMASWSLILFFSAGRFVGALEPLNLPVYPVLAGVFVYSGALAAGFMILRQMRGGVGQLNMLFTVVSAVLVATVLVSIAATWVWQASSGAGAATAAGPQAQTPQGAYPDIYFIVLDSYPREDTLRNVFGFDNSGFLSELGRRGFYVANRSRSNYPATFLSIASALNMRYLDDVAQSAGRGVDFYDPKSYYVPYKMIRESEVRRVLKSKGYTTVNFRSGWGPTNDMMSADYEYGYASGWQSNEFLSVLASTTALRFVSDYRLMAFEWRNNVLYTFENLGTSGDGAGPKFVTAHIISPHPPFLFDRDGNPLAESDLNMEGSADTDAKAKFVDQVIFVNRKTLETVDRILNSSTTPPVIIIQGDHGTWSTDEVFGMCSGQVGPQGYNSTQLDERMDIFNAYLIPGGGGRLYPSITPVNSFRAVFDGVFGENYTLLPDRSFFSCWNRHPFDFTELPPEA